MSTTIQISGCRLRRRTEWTHINFVPDDAECFVHPLSGNVVWTDGRGIARELGTMTRPQLEALIATEQAALDVE